MIGISLALSPGNPALGKGGPFITPSRPISGMVLNNATLDDTAKCSYLASIGCRDWRLFYDSLQLFEASDATARQAINAARVERIKLALSRGASRVIVCLTPSETLGTVDFRRSQVQVDPAKFALYCQYAAEFYGLCMQSGIRSSQMAAQPFNEPQRDNNVNDAVIAGGGTANSRDWSTILAPQLHAAVRAALPKPYEIIVPSADRAEANRIASLPVALMDGNTIFASHEYAQTYETHPRDLQGMSRKKWPVANFPGGKTADIAEMDLKLAELSLSTEAAATARAKNIEEINFAWDSSLSISSKPRLLALWQSVADWADANGIPRWRIGSTETGMQGHFAGVGHDHADRVAWLTDVRDVLSSLGFGLDVVHRDLGDAFAMFDYVTGSGASTTWLEHIKTDIAAARGWTAPNRYGAAFPCSPDDISTWTAKSSATIANEARGIRISDGTAFKGMSYQGATSGTLGKKYRLEVLIDHIAGTTPELTISLRRTVTGTVYGSVIVSSRGLYAVEATASLDTGVCAVIEANNKADLVCRVAQIRFVEVVA